MTGEGPSTRIRCETMVLLIHASATEAGGVVNATVFYALSLAVNDVPVVIWTASDGLAALARRHGLEVEVHRSLVNAGRAIVDARLIESARRLRGRLHAVIHQGDKMWVFGRLWLRRVPEFVVYHNPKHALRWLFSNWLAVSTAHVRELEEYANSRGLLRRVQLIRNGPLPVEIVSRPAANQIRRIGTLSNFASKKGMATLIEAFARLPISDVELVLAGDGRHRTSCENLAASLGISGRVHWTGWLTDTREFFNDIDLFCSPSLNEPFGLVIVEAMQAGLPVVATATYGARDIVVPGETGWLVEPGDAVHLARTLEEAMSQPEQLAALGENGRRRVRQVFSPECAGKLLMRNLGLWESPCGERS